MARLLLKICLTLILTMIFTVFIMINTGGEIIIANTYTNPVGDITDIGDPFVMKYKDKYYLYATSMPTLGFKVWESDNLVDWELKGMALDSSLEGNKQGMGDFWAPEVIHFNDKFYMTYSTRDIDGYLKIALAVSEEPLGPFINLKAPLFDREQSFIDGHIFVDDDGTPYLYYDKDCSDNIVDGAHVSQIYVQEMTEDLTELKGEAVLAVDPSQSWEDIGGDWQWNEGAFVLKHKELYYLMYSANFYASADYSIGYATAEHPLGPWTKYEGNPILEKDLGKGISGPGHNSVTVSPDGSELFIVYHTHTYPEFPSGDRNVNIDRLYFEGGILKVHGPTRSPQPMPSGIE